MKHMIFVDGSNFLIELGKYLAIEIRADKPSKDLFVMASRIINTVTSEHVPKDSRLIRRYWFGSYVGSEEYLFDLQSELRSVEFEPVLFRRRNKREKGVDIALTKEMLINAFNHNYDLAILIAGDEDYTGLVNDLKRYGPIIYGAFFAQGLSNNLKTACDRFFSLEKTAGKSSREYLMQFKSKT